MRLPLVFAAVALYAVPAKAEAQTVCALAQASELRIGAVVEGTLTKNSCRGVYSGRAELFMQPYRITLADALAVDIRIDSEKMLSARLVDSKGDALALVFPSGPFTKPGALNRFTLPAGTYYLLISTYFYTAAEPLSYRASITRDANSDGTPTRLIECTPIVAKRIGSAAAAGQPIDSYDRAAFPKAGGGCDFDDKTVSVEARRGSGIPFYRLDVPVEQSVGIAVSDAIANLWYVEFPPNTATVPDPIRPTGKPFLFGTAIPAQPFQIKLPAGTYFVALKPTTPCPDGQSCVAGKPYNLKVTQSSLPLPGAGTAPVVATAMIGQQEWMTTNLAVDRLRNGDPIRHASSLMDFYELGRKRIPASVCFDPCQSFGIMYNQFAIKGGIAPFGWRVPTQKDFADLIQSQGGPVEAQRRLRTTGRWRTDVHPAGNNASGFSALPGGKSWHGPDKADQSVGYWSWDDGILLSISPKEADLASDAIGRTTSFRGLYVRLIRISPRNQRLPEPWHTTLAAAATAQGSPPANVSSRVDAARDVWARAQDLVNKGMTSFEMKMYNQAAAHFQDATVLIPHYRDALANTGIAFLWSKDPGLAVSYLKRLVSVSPLDSTQWKLLGTAYNELARQQSDVARGRAYTDSMGASLNTARNLPLQIDVVSWMTDGMNAQLELRATRRAAASANSELNVEFLDATGAVVASAKMLLPSAAAGETSVRRVAGVAEGIVAYRYSLQRHR